MKPGPFPHTVPLCVGFLTENVEAGALGAPGTWRRTSPEEVLMAFYKAIARDITAGKDPEYLKQWLRHMLTTPMMFTCHQTEADLEWRASQMREDIKQNETLARTPVQRIFEIVQKRKQFNVKTSGEMVKLYESNMTMSSRSEKITPSFVDMALTIWDRALCKPGIQAIVLKVRLTHIEVLTHGRHKESKFDSDSRFGVSIVFCDSNQTEVRVAA